MARQLRTAKAEVVQTSIDSKPKSAELLRSPKYEPQRRQTAARIRQLVAAYENQAAYDRLKGLAIGLLQERDTCYIHLHYGDKKPDERTNYRLITLPEHGILMRDGEALKAGAVVIAKECNDKRVTFTLHDGSEESFSSFKFRARNDGETKWGNEFTHKIDVAAHAQIGLLIRTQNELRRPPIDIEAPPGVVLWEDDPTRKPQKSVRQTDAFNMLKDAIRDIVYFILPAKRGALTGSGATQEDRDAPESKRLLAAADLLDPTPVKMDAAERIGPADDYPTPKQTAIDDLQGAPRLAVMSYNMVVRTRPELAGKYKAVHKVLQGFPDDSTYGTGRHDNPLPKCETWCRALRRGHAQLKPSPEDQQPARQESRSAVPLNSLD